MRELSLAEIFKTIRFHTEDMFDRIEVASTGIQNPALAKTLVQAAKRDYPFCQIFVQWKRLSDGQVGYLNPDGNHVITGSAW